VRKAEQLLGFRAETPLDEILTEVVPWIARALEDGSI
jgi:nucleoside-diphosphate-sugar epimerase